MIIVVGRKSKNIKMDRFKMQTDINTDRLIQTDLKYKKWTDIKIQIYTSVFFLR